MDVRLFFLKVSLKGNPEQQINDRANLGLMDPFDLRLWPGFAQAGGDMSSPAITDQVAIDSRRLNSANALFIALPGSQDDGHRFVGHAADAGARFAIVNHKWTPPAPLPENFILLRTGDPLAAFQEIAKTYRKQQKATVIGITGSYGKTMVKDLLQAMMGSVKETVASPESFNSQIGVALSLLTINHTHKIAIIEAGISKKSEMDVLADMIAPDCVIVTHVGKRHLNTLGDLETTAAEKFKLAARAKEWVLTPETPHLMPHLSAIVSPHYFWDTPSAEMPHAESKTLYNSSKMSYSIAFPDGNKFYGEAHFGFCYYLDLVNITLKAAWLLGASSDAICKTLKTYAPEPIRTEIWKSLLGTTFINDAYCSDPQSVDLALRHLSQYASLNRKFFVFGGMRGETHQQEIAYKRIGQAINPHQLDLLLLVGQAPFTPLVEEVKRGSPTTEIVFCPGYMEALNFLKTRVKPEDFVLIKGKKKESLDTLTETFNDSICNNQCMINLAAIQSNIATIRAKLVKNSRIMVMVKAHAYGTDEIRMAKFLETYGVDILGVSYVDEGVALKRAGVTQEIFVINAAPYEAAKIVNWGLTVGVSEKEFIQAVAEEAARQNKKIHVHLHVDTGMSRFGCRPEDALSMAMSILDSPFLLLDGIMTHFACADNPLEDRFTLQQASTFDTVIAFLEKEGIHPKWRHACNSSAMMRFDFPQYTMTRIGLAVYGLYPSDAAKSALDLRLAFSLTSRIVGINSLKKGETVSYGRSYQATEDQQKIAVLPIGYFDGLHRNYSGKGYVVIRGKKAPMIGKICMDFMMVDITAIPDAHIGDSVLIFGEDEYGNYLSPEELATGGDSIVYELITCLGPRIQRIFVHEEAHHLR